MTRLKACILCGGMLWHVEITIIAPSSFHLSLDTEPQAKHRVPTPIVMPLPQLRPTTPGASLHGATHTTQQVVDPNDGWHAIQKTYSTKSTTARVLSPQPPTPPDAETDAMPIAEQQGGIHVHTTDFTLANQVVNDQPPEAPIPSQLIAVPAFVNIDGGEVLALGDKAAQENNEEEEGMGLEVGPSVQVGRDAEQLMFLDT